jgi:hypothetical protein
MQKRFQKAIEEATEARAFFVLFVVLVMNARLTSSKAPSTSTSPSQMI